MGVIVGSDVGALVGDTLGLGVGAFLLNVGVDVGANEGSPLG